jgi:hypothetical protein
LRWAFEELGADGAVLKLIAHSLVDVAFKEIITIVSSYPLKGASLDEVEKLFDSMWLFCQEMETMIIDRRILPTCRMALGRSFSESFHEEHFPRLKDALAVEKWVRIEPEQKHIDILREQVDRTFL